MAITETAHLVAELDMKNNLAAPAAEATAEVKAMDAAAGGASTKVSTLSRVATGAGGALTHMKNQVTGVAKVIGSAGLLGGSVAAAAFLKDSIHQAEQFVEVSDRLSQLTGMNIQQTSKWSDALDYFGVQADQQLRIVGFLQKSIGMLATTQGGAKKIQQDYGFAIRDSTGHLKNAATIFSDFIDYFNKKGIPVQEKAALGMKLFGRSWQEVLPIVEQGGKAWKKAIQDGMELTPQQVADAHKMRDAQREWNDSIGDLKTQIGLVALPALADLAHGAATFVNEHQQDFVNFFKSAIEYGKQFAGFVANTVLPTVSGLAQDAERFWNGIPAPLKDLLIKGFVADRTVKFLFGIDLAGLAKDAIGGIIGGGIKGVLGSFFQRGGPGNPMYVVAEGGLGGGPFGAAGGGSGILGKVAIAGSVLIAGASIAALAEQFKIFQDSNAQAQADLQTKADAVANRTGAESLNQLKILSDHLNSLQGFDRIIADTWGSQQSADALINLADNIAQDNKLTTAQQMVGLQRLRDAQAAAISHGWTAAADAIGTDISVLAAAVQNAPAPATAAQIADAVSGAQNPILDQLREQAKLLRENNQPQGQGQDLHNLTEEQKAAMRARYREGGLGGDIDKRGSTWSIHIGQALGPWSDRIRAGVKDNATAISHAIKELQAKQSQDLARGNAQVASHIGRNIEILKAKLAADDATQQGTLTRISNKPPPTVNVTTNVSTFVSTRTIATRTTQSSRYGPVGVD